MNIFPLFSAGQEVSLETSNALLDLLCFHGNKPRTSLVELVDQSIATAQKLQAALNEDAQEVCYLLLYVCVRECPDFTW